MITYKYSIQNDFSKKLLDSSRLTKEIAASDIVTVLDHINTTGDVCDIVFKAELSVEDKALLDGFIAIHSGDPLPPVPESVLLLGPKNGDNSPLFTLSPRTGIELVLVTHDWTDPTTWYTESERAEDVVLTPDVDKLAFSSPHKNWIDMEHGKIFDEDAVKFDVDHQYSTLVFVDDVLQTMREPLEPSGGDYEINYKTGQAIFFSPVSGKVTATYSYENGSMWVMAPTSGKRLDIEVAEAQFSTDLDMTDTVDFEIWVYNPYDLPNKVKYTWTSYKTVRNFLDEALGSYPVIKAFGGATRGVPSDVYGFPFRYGTVRSLRSSEGVELRVRLRHDRQFKGSYATTTLYCTVHNE